MCMYMKTIKTQLNLLSLIVDLLLPSAKFM